MAIEIVDFPIKNCDFPWQNVSSPEGIMGYFMANDGDEISVHGMINLIFHFITIFHFMVNFMMVMMMVMMVMVMMMMMMMMMMIC